MSVEGKCARIFSVIAIINIIISLNGRSLYLESNFKFLVPDNIFLHVIVNLEILSLTL